IPDGPRTYPVTGTIFLLPLSYEDNYAAEVVACGGSAEKKPFGDFDTGRLMGDYIHMSDGKVLIVNGAGMGYADKGDVTNRKHVARLPQKIPLLYDPKATLGSRFTRMAEAKYVRVCHSTATLIPDGTVFIVGSNPNSAYYDTYEYPTEYRIEIFTPPYLLKGIPRPIIRNIANTTAFNPLINIKLIMVSLHIRNTCL
ncbi:5922_t:CDS:2, partial [Gigaspora margarita]